MQRYEVLFTGNKDGWMKMLHIESQDLVTAQQWADKQLAHWGRRKATFKVTEVAAKPVVPEVKAEKKTNPRKSKKARPENRG